MTTVNPGIGEMIDVTDSAMFVAKKWCFSSEEYQSLARLNAFR